MQGDIEHISANQTKLEKLFAKGELKRAKLGKDLAASAKKFVNRMKGMKNQADSYNLATTHISANQAKLEKLFAKGELKRAKFELRKLDKDLDASANKFVDRMKGMKNQADKYNLAATYLAATKSLRELRKDYAEYIEENDVEIAKQKELRRQYEESSERIHEFIQDKAKWVVGIATGFAILIMKEFDAVRAGIVGTFAVATPASAKLAATAQETYVSFAHLGASAEQVTETYTELSRQIGSTDPSKLKILANESMRLQTALGVGVDESILLTRAMRKSGMDGQKGFEVLTKASNKFGVSVGQFARGLKDIGDEILSMDFNKVANASAAAAQIGLSIGDISKSMEGFQDFDSFQKIFDFNTLLGSSFDATDLQAKAFFGDMEGFTELLRTQLVGKDFDKLPLAVKRQLATIMNISVGQLHTISNLNQADIREQIKQQNEINKLEEIASQKMGAMNALWVRLKAASLQALAPLAKLLSKVVMKLMDANGELNVLGKVMFGFIALITAGFAVSKIASWLKVVKGIGPVITSLSAKMFTFSAAKKSADIAMGTGSAASMFTMKGALVFAAAVGVVALAFMGLGKAIEWAGNGIEKMKGFSMKDVGALAALSGVFALIGANAYFAASGMAAFSLAAIPAALMATVVPIAPTQSNSQIDYWKDSSRPCLFEQSETD